MGDRIAKTETYMPRLRQAMIDAYDSGERNLKARFGETQSCHGLGVLLVPVEDTARFEEGMKNNMSSLCRE